MKLPHQKHHARCPLPSRWGDGCGGARDRRAYGIYASVLNPKSVPFYFVAASVRRQKRWMLARMLSAVLVQRNGLGAAFVAAM